jgi:hypothetical protein
MGTNVKRARDPALAQAIANIGGEAETARRMGVSKQAVWWWYRCPSHHVKDMERESGVPRWLLRPDLFDPPDFEQEHDAFDSSLTDPLKASG